MVVHNKYLEKGFSVEGGTSEIGGVLQTSELEGLRSKREPFNSKLEGKRSNVAVLKWGWVLQNSKLEVLNCKREAFCLNIAPPPLKVEPSNSTLPLRAFKVLSN